MRRLPAIALVLAAAGCTRPLGSRPLPEPIEVAPPPPPQAGSLWRPELAMNYPALDVKAHFPGDLLTVVIAEQAKGSKNASTETSAESSISASVQDFFGVPAAAVKFLPKAFTGDAVVTAETARESSGEGTTKREDTLSGTITVTVTAVDPAGNLRVRGRKIVTVNREDQLIELVGTVRPEDVGSDNTVSSTRLADARVTYAGYGTVSGKQGVPLVHRLFDWVWPF